jgi:integrase
MKFTIKNLEAIEPSEARQTFFDESMNGLALKVSPSGHKAFYYCYRAGKGRNAPKKQIQLGTFPDMTVEHARLKARQLAAQVVSGQDPAKELQKAKEAQTLAEVLDLFIAEHVRPKLKPKSIELYEGSVNKHIIPVLGKKKVEEITHRDIAKLHHGLGKTPYAGNRVAAILSKFFNWCEKNGYRDRGSNPVTGLEKYKEEKIEDFLTSDQLAALGTALSALEKNGIILPLPAAALRLLMLTGMRLMEVLSLRWEYLDLEAGTAKLPDSKTGFKIVPLSAPAVDIFKSLTAHSDYVFPSATSASGHMEGLVQPWKFLKANAELKGRWRIHDLRHAFASIMVNSGSSLPVIGKVLGHATPSTTARYAHLEKSPAQKAAAAAANMIAEGWKKPPADNVISGNMEK